MRIMRLFLTAFIIISLSAFFINCSDDSKNSSSAQTEWENEDTDGDGLTNEFERDRLMSPYLKDTDGDGWDDNVEYSSSTNPSVADMPKLKVTLKSVPLISVHGTNTEGITESISTGYSEELAEGRTESRSDSTSMGLQFGWSQETTVEVSTGFMGPDVSTSTTFGTHMDYSYDTTMQWGTEETEEFSRVWDETKTREESQELQINGGSIKVAVEIANVGDVACTITSCDFLASISNPWTSNISDFITPVGTLSYDFGDGQELQIGGTITKTYEYDDIGFQEIEKLLKNSSGIRIQLSGYQLTYDGKDFTVQHTDIRNKTALVKIDYGLSSNREPEEYRVGVLHELNPDSTGYSDRYRPLSMDRVMKILEIGYAEGEQPGAPEGANSGLWKIRNVENEQQYRKDWILVHITREDNQEVIKCYSVLNDSFKLRDIKIKPQDTVELIFSEDKDKDGLMATVERMLGSSDSYADNDGDGVPDSFDSDKDGIDDGTEFRGYTFDDPLAGEIKISTDPAKPDSDYDGLNDREEKEYNTNPRNPDTDGDMLNDRDETKGDPENQYNPRVKDYIPHQKGSIKINYFGDFNTKVDFDVSIVAAEENKEQNIMIIKFCPTAGGAGNLDTRIGLPADGHTYNINDTLGENNEGQILYISDSPAERHLYTDDKFTWDLITEGTKTYTTYYRIIPFSDTQYGEAYTLCRENYQGFVPVAGTDYRLDTQLYIEDTEGYIHFSARGYTFTIKDLVNLHHFGFFYAQFKRSSQVVFIPDTDYILLGDNALTDCLLDGLLPVPKYMRPYVTKELYDFNSTGFTNKFKQCKGSFLKGHRYSLNYTIFKPYSEEGLQKIKYIYKTEGTSSASIRPGRLVGNTLPAYSLIGQIDRSENHKHYFTLGDKRKAKISDILDGFNGNLQILLNREVDRVIEFGEGSSSNIFVSIRKWSRWIDKE